MRQVRHFVLWALVISLVPKAADARTKSQGTSIAGIESQASSLFQQGKYAESFAAYGRCADLGSARCEDSACLDVRHRQGNQKGP